VIETGADWQPIGDVYLSDGEKNDQATLEYRVWLEPALDAPVAQGE
jgi:hypothetical protein